MSHAPTLTAKQSRRQPAPTRPHQHAFRTPRLTLWPLIASCPEEFCGGMQEVVRGKVVLDIGTGALALLAIFAAEAGAAKVYAVEANGQACARARETVHDRGLSDVVHVVEGLSTNVSLPERVDLIVHEILGEIASIEGAPYVIRDAQQRHLKSFPAAWRTSVPAAASSALCPCEMPDAEYWEQKEFPVILPPGTSTMKLTAFPRRLLLSDEWSRMEELDFEAPGGLPLRQRHTASWTARRCVCVQRARVPVRVCARGRATPSSAYFVCLRMPRGAPTFQKARWQGARIPLCPLPLGTSCLQESLASTTRRLGSLHLCPPVRWRATARSKALLSAWRLRLRPVDGRFRRGVGTPSPRRCRVKGIGL
jgi:hypothetical protein